MKKERDRERVRVRVCECVKGITGPSFSSEMAADSVSHRLTR